jgi:hypothetical protein
MLTLVFSFAVAGAEDKPTQPVADGDTVCTFGDGQQVSIRYAEVPYKGSDLPHGKIWEPGNRPMYLFSQAELELGSSKVPAGAYSLYPIPGDETWTLVVNKGVEKGAHYDSSKDVAKLPAETGKLPHTAERLKLYFGQIAPKTCTLRIDYGKQRAFADFKQK